MPLSPMEPIFNGVNPHSPGLACAGGDTKTFPSDEDERKSCVGTGLAHGAPQGLAQGPGCYSGLGEDHSPLHWRHHADHV